ncbi:MAG: DUF4129 domain-containing protein [Flavobacteriales bacterium]|nr:DUF4129 domain-containing protein [Flavobacteriales bacterium]
MLIQLSVTCFAHSQVLIDQDSIQYYIDQMMDSTEIEQELSEPTFEETPAVQEYPENNPTPVWQDDQWNKVKKEYHYDPDPKEEEKPDKEDEDDQSEPETADNGDSFIESLNTFFNTPLGKMVAIVVAASLLILLILKLISGKPLGFNKKIKVLQEIDLENPEELPEEDTLDRLLRIAIEKGDHKTAVRILYLKLIRQLSESKFIQWQKDKTNRDYLNEMRTKSTYRSFRDLTLIYEVIWYGDQEIGGHDYQKVSDMFSNYQNNLNGSTQEN